MFNITEHPPESAPIVALSAEEEAPADLLRRHWLDGLPGAAREYLPLPDLLGWLVQRYPQRDVADTLAGFTLLVFDADFTATFSGGKPCDYQTTDGTLDAEPVQLASA